MEMMSQSQPHLMGWCVQSLFISREDGAQVWGNRLLAHPSLKHPVSTFPPVNKDNYRANELRKKVWVIDTLNGEINLILIEHLAR